MRMFFTRETVLFEILRAFPSSIHVFERHGMSCGGCMHVTTESLEVAATKHGVDVQKLIDELNALEESILKPQGGARV